LIKKVGNFFWLDTYINKKRVRHSLHTKDRNLAVHRAAKLQRELEVEANKEDMSFEAFCKKYIKYAWDEKPSSARAEELRLNKIKKFFKKLGIHFLSDIKIFHIEQLKTELRETGLNKKKRGVSKATVNRYLQLLRGMFYKAEAWEIYEGKNPLRQVRFYRENPQTEALAPERLKEVLQIAQDISDNPQSALQKEFYTMCVLAVNTGMRRSEVLNLRWENIKEGEIKIKGKGDKSRAIPINKRVATPSKAPGHKEESLYLIFGYELE